MKTTLQMPSGAPNITNARTGHFGLAHSASYATTDPNECSTITLVPPSAQVAELLASCVRSSPSELRDFAVLPLLGRLGLLSARSPPFGWRTSTGVPGRLWYGARRVATDGPDIRHAAQDQRTRQCPYGTIANAHPSPAPL
jgi:hypothetical protein